MVLISCRGHDDLLVSTCSHSALIKVQTRSPSFILSGASGATSENRGMKVSKAMALVVASGAAYKNQQRIMMAVPSRRPEGPVTCTEQ